MDKEGEWRAQQAAYSEQSGPKDEGGGRFNDERSEPKNMCRGASV